MQIYAAASLKSVDELIRMPFMHAIRFKHERVSLEGLTSTNVLFHVKIFEIFDDFIYPLVISKRLD